MHGQRNSIVDTLDSWRSEGISGVLATVVASSDSSPRGLGAQLLVGDDDLWIGGLTGGCAEAAVLRAAREIRDRGDSGEHNAATSISMTKDTLESVGPVCGATLTVLIEYVDAELTAALSAVQRLYQDGHTAQLSRSYATGDTSYSEGLGDGTDSEGLGDGTVTRRVGVAVQQATPARRSHVPEVLWVNHGNLWALEENIPPPPRLVVCGGGDVAIELFTVAARLGWRLALIDPRPAFRAYTVSASPPITVHPVWPTEIDRLPALTATDACLAAAHDERLDTPFLDYALQSDAAYIGSIGSRVVQYTRNQLIQATHDSETASRHHGPAGLNLGGSSAAEIAVSVIAEITATWYGRDSKPLHKLNTPIRAL